MPAVNTLQLPHVLAILRVMIFSIIIFIEIALQSLLFILVSNDFGFGLMDAGNMIKYAKDWSSVPKQLSCEVKLDVSSSK